MLWYLSIFKPVYTMLNFRHLLFLFLFIGAVLDASATPDYSLMVPMRDGTHLPTDVYLPKNHQGPSPLILIRSPAGPQAASAIMHTYLTGFGYVVAIQTTRSALDLEGKTLPYLADGWIYQQDGYDTVEWLAKNPVCNGKVGTVGSSALGITQLLMAPTAPPSLVCQYIGVAASSLYHQGIYPGGQLLKNQVEGWLGYYAKDSGVFAFVANQPFMNEFWESLDTRTMAHHVNVPGLHQGGWYDTFIKGTLESFTSRQENGAEGAKGTQKLLIGPWDHYWPKETAYGDFKVPQQGKEIPFPITTLDWFNHHMKGESSGIENLPSVMYYVMGTFDGSPSSGNIWRTASEWPVKSKPLHLYLTKDQELALAPGVSRDLISYKADSGNPVPTIGGRNLFLASGPKDQQTIESRDDVIVFTSAPLDEDLEVTGEILAKITLESDHPDADVALRLTDVYPDGRSILIADGLTRTAHLNSRQVEIDLWSTSIVFAKGHRIRLSIAGSNYPKYEVNKLVGLTGTNTAENKIAMNTIDVGGESPSVLILPVVRKGNTWLTEYRGEH